MDGEHFNPKETENHIESWLRHRPILYKMKQSKCEYILEK